MKVKTFDGRVYEIKFATTIKYLGDGIGVSTIHKLCETEEEGSTFIKSAINGIKAKGYEFVEASITIKRILSQDRLEKRKCHN